MIPLTTFIQGLHDVERKQTVIPDADEGYPTMVPDEWEVYQTPEMK